MAIVQQSPTDLSPITRYILSLPWMDYLNTTDAALQQGRKMGVAILDMVDRAVLSLLSEDHLDTVLTALQQAYTMVPATFDTINHAVFVADGIIEPFAPGDMRLAIWIWIFLMVLIIIACFF
ncbi:hypothetical protein JMJ35_006412 [Cladonia borealis]|uniref:Uncharacterized protein n=1 Tax=Cladonia borealis TaxID=184061 RepID=A0AA39QZA5_9LECA|nr:hypothetical protein JMJ35_006412 [Cladonia borealis]